MDISEPLAENEQAGYKWAAFNEIPCVNCSIVQCNHWNTVPISKRIYWNRFKGELLRKVRKLELKLYVKELGLFGVQN